MERRNVPSCSRKAKDSASNLRFKKVYQLAECYGFAFVRQKGSHRIYKSPSWPKLLKLQGVNDEAKPVQVDKLLEVIDRISEGANEMKEQESVNRYSRQVFYSERYEAFVATSPEFPGVSSFGPTADEALDELDTALELGIETNQEEGWPLPEPAELPTMSLPSGEFRLRLPRTLHARLTQQAKLEGVSANSLVTVYVAQGLTGTVFRDVDRE